MSREERKRNRGAAREEGEAGESGENVHKFNLPDQSREHTYVFIFIYIYMKLLRRLKPITEKGQTDLARLLLRLLIQPLHTFSEC